MLARLFSWLFDPAPVEPECKHKFSKWKKKSWRFARPPIDSKEFVLWGGEHKREFTQEFQERACELCGYIEQEELEYGE